MALVTLSGGDSEIDEDGEELVGRRSAAEGSRRLGPVAVGDRKLGVFGKTAGCLAASCA